MESQLNIEKLNLDNQSMEAHKISIAPMMGITDNYFRYFIRLLTQHSTLYTEMIHSDTIIHSKRYIKELYFEENQNPIVIQLGGNNPQELGGVSKICKEMGYDQINLNCGCPSSKVQNHNFGAVLMDYPDLVAECVKNIRVNSNLETTIKCRLGLNVFNQGLLDTFIDTVSKKGQVNHFIIHSRIAIMDISTEKNRKIPPLQYGHIFSLKKKFDYLNFSVNGGIKCLDEAENFLNKYYLNDENELVLSKDYINTGIIGCMIGRAAYENPWILTDIDRRFYKKKNLNYTKKEVVHKYADFIDKKSQQLEVDDINPFHVKFVKPLIYLFPNERGNTQFRHNLHNLNHKYNSDFTIYDHILNCFDEFEKINYDAANKL